MERTREPNLEPFKKEKDSRNTPQMVFDFSVCILWLTVLVIIFFNVVVRSVEYASVNHSLINDFKSLLVSLVWVLLVVVWLNFVSVLVREYNK